jgi:putative transposase
MRSGARSDAQVGIDLGFTHFAILSSGKAIVSPKALRPHEARLAKRQRALARARHASKNRAKWKKRVAQLHAHITDARRAFLHKRSTRLISENQEIAIESLSVKNMQRNRSLATSISDASWSELVRRLEYKAQGYGRTLTGIDRWYPSSKRCSVCGHTKASLPLCVRTGMCPECGTTHDRDINAARNILPAGLAVSAHGEAVSPVLL